MDQDNNKGMWLFTLPVRTHTNAHAYTYLHIFTHTHTYAYTYLHIFTHTYSTHTHQTREHTCMKTLDV